MLDVRKAKEDLATPRVKASAVTAQSPSIATVISFAESVSEAEEEINVSCN